MFITILFILAIMLYVKLSGSSFESPPHVNYKDPSASMYKKPTKPGVFDDNYSILYELMGDDEPEPTKPIKRPTPVLDILDAKYAELATFKKQRASYSALHQFMSAADKVTYLKSKEWKAISKLVKERDDYKCVVCSSPHIEVHHQTYIRLGAEHIDDLVCLCRTHHQAIHDNLGYNRTTNYYI